MSCESDELSNVKIKGNPLPLSQTILPKKLPSWPAGGRLDTTWTEKTPPKSNDDSSREKSTARGQWELNR